MKKERYLSIDEIVSLPKFLSTEISNDGQMLAFVKETADNDNTYQSHIWIYEKLKNQLYPLTIGKVESTHPLYSQDFKMLAYLSNSQIYIKSLDNNNIQVTNVKEGVSSFKWSHDGKGIYYITMLPESEVIKKRKEIYGDIIFFDKEYRYNCLCYLDLEKKYEKKIIGDCNLYIQEFDISDDCNKIAFTATPTPSLNDINNKEIYILDIIDNKTEKLNIDAIIRGKVVFSPDSNKICYTRTINEKKHYEYNKRDNILEIYDLETSKTIQPLKNFDSSINLISWSSKGILINWKDRTNNLIGLLNEDGQLDIQGDKDDCIIISPSITRDGNHISYIKATPIETFEVYLDDMKITNESDIYIDKIKSKKELVSWKNNDGLELEGVISLPQDFNTNKKYPLLVKLGGAYLTPSFCKWFPIEQLVEKGVVVFEPNKRGYYGYGNDFMKGDYRKQGIAYYEDIISGVDMLIDRGIVDRNNVGITGFSEGGYTAVFSSLYSNRFKVVSTFEGSNNWDTLYVSTGIPYYIKQILGATPWDDKEIYEKTSTMTYIKSASAPTLILHIDEEPIEPLVNGYELYRGLKDMNVETELVILKDDKHFSENLRNNIVLMKLNLKWFSHFLLGETIEGFKSLI